MKIKKGDFVIIDVETVKSVVPSSGEKKEKGKDSSVGGFGELEKTPDKVETPDFDVSGEYGPGYERSGINTQKKSSGPKISSTSSIGKGGSVQELEKKWKNALGSALPLSSSLSSKARSLLTTIQDASPRVDWKKELNKFMDQTLGGYDQEPWSKRFLGQDQYLYANKPAGVDTVKTLVLPVDTSGSISKEQIGAFLNEVWHICENFEVDNIYIVYTSDSIDSIDVVEKGGKPDLSMIRSTGGNREGFYPPFRFIQDPQKYQGLSNRKLPKKIDPSAVIYFTDTQAKYPTVKDFGIGKYDKKVFWFICVKEGSPINEPPFGKKLFVPINSKGNFF